LITPASYDGAVGESMWADAVAYERYIGRWSRMVAAEFLAWLGVPDGRSWLDVGCGSGALSQAILRFCEPSAVLGIDPSPAFVEAADQSTRDPRARFAVADAGQIPAPDGALDAVVSGLVLNFIPDVPAALGEMRRVTRPDGVMSAYVWDYAGRRELLRSFWAAVTVEDPESASLDEGRRFPICDPDALHAAFSNAGLGDVTLRAIDVPTDFEDFDAYWRPFLGGVGPGPAYVASLESDERERLRERLRSSLPSTSDGSIHLIARAWAVRGRR
jgi:SAM-dependent methyltransferase